MSRSGRNGRPKPSWDREPNLGLYPTRPAPVNSPEPTTGPASLPQEALDLLAIHPEAVEDAVADDDGGHAEATRAREEIEARVGISAHVAHVHRHPAGLEESERGFAVGVAFHGKEQGLFHRG